MALVWKDRVLETTTTTGTGTLTLAGAVTGYQTFAAVGDGNTCYFCIYAVDGFGNPSGVWEVGLGTYTASGTTLARTTVYANSSGTQVALDLAAGAKRVMLTAAAAHLTTIPVVNGGTGLTALGSALQVLRVNAGGTALEYGTLSTGLTVGTTAITSGTSGRLLYDAAGTLGETAAVTYATSTANLTVTASGAAVVPAVFKGAVSQTGNLTEWQTSTGYTRTAVDADGILKLYHQNYAPEYARVYYASGTLYFDAGANPNIAAQVSTAFKLTHYAAAQTRVYMTTLGEARVVSGGAFNWSSGSADSENFTAHAGLSSPAAASVKVTNGSTGFGSLTAGATDAATNSVSDGLTLNHATSGTPAAGFGIGVSLKLQSSTTTDQDAAALQAVWADATHATRKGRLTLNVYDTAARECLRLEASGSAPMLGLYGTAAVAQYATTGTVTGYTGGGGTALTHSDTFTGNTGSTAYTIGDIVRALKLLGAIAA